MLSFSLNIILVYLINLKYYRFNFYNIHMDADYENHFLAFFFSLILLFIKTLFISKALSYSHLNLKTHLCFILSLILCLVHHLKNRIIHFSIKHPSLISLYQNH